MADNQNYAGELVSPAGFAFGVQGWSWGQQRPSAITFFLNGVARVSDQHGRPIRGTVKEDGTPIYFVKCNHMQVVEALLAERVDVVAEMNRVGSPCPRCKGTRREGERWCLVCYHEASGESTGTVRTIDVSGWPQLPYALLSKIKVLPPTPLEELRKIKDPELRRDALKARREADAEHAKDISATSDDEE